jgi:hypothetical protein
MIWLRAMNSRSMTAGAGVAGPGVATGTVASAAGADWLWGAAFMALSCRVRIAARARQLTVPRRAAQERDLRRRFGRAVSDYSPVQHRRSPVRVIK